LEQARALVSRAVQLFWDESKQAYRTAPQGQADLLTNPFALHDNAVPSGSSTLTEAQVALAALTSSDSDREQAGKYLQKMRDEMLRNPFAYGHLLLAADSWLEGTPGLFIVGTGAQAEPFLRAVASTYAPAVSVGFRDVQSATPKLLENSFGGKELVEGRAAAYLCRNFSCQMPVTRPPELQALLEQ